MKRTEKMKEIKEEWNKINRRRFLRLSTLSVGGILASGGLVYANSWQSEGRRKEQQRYLIGVCDWMILKRQKIGAFELSEKIGVDGVEVDMGGLGDRKTFDNKLIDPSIRQEFLRSASSHNLQICSLAMSAFYAQSFAEREHAVDLVKGCIDIMKAMKVKTAFLPMGVQGDLVKYPHLWKPIVKRLQIVGQYAEKNNVVIGIETSLDAKGEVNLLNDIGFSAIQSYFNFENPLQEGRSLCEELKILGKDRICQIHCTNKDGEWLQNDPQIDMNSVKKTLDEMGWNGWLVLERSRNIDDVHNVLKNYGTNADYMKTVFQD